MINDNEVNKVASNFKRIIEIEKTDLSSGNNIGLFWKYNMDTRTFTFFNGEDLDGIEGSVEEILNNLIKAQEIVVKEDFFRFKLFIESVRNRNEASVIFRVNNSNGLKYWIKASGVPEALSGTFYYGYVRNITMDVDLINSMLEKDLDRQVMIQHENHPVILVDMKNKAIISYNTSAFKLFEYTFHEFNELKFQDIFQADQNPNLSKIYETCLMDGNWDGNILLVKSGKRQFEGTINISQLSLRDKNLLKISIYEIGRNILGIKDGSHSKKEEFKQNLVAILKKKKNLNEILDALLKNQYDSFIFDAVMYIDLRKKKGKQNFFASGDVINTDQLGMPYDYSGLTQEILDDELDFLIIKDTMNSIKPIDWALFIPYGIRSYFVKPFFHGSKLKSMLILCSTELNRFTKQEIHLYELYFPAFLKALKIISKHDKN